MAMKKLSARQEFIVDAQKKLNNRIRGLLVSLMDEYEEKFGFNFTDVWLWDSGMDFSLLVIEKACKKTMSKRVLKFPSVKFHRRKGKVVGVESRI